MSSVNALQVFASEPDRFDLVISDMAMPKMAGDKLALEIMKIRPDIPIIICTGYSSILDRVKADSLGIAGYLMKPLSMKDLSVTIRQVLDSRTVSMV
jgi:DNA-binding NtrC family response regulator